MLIPETQRTGEYIRKQPYDEIKRLFRAYAERWNGLWQVWQGFIPDWGNAWSGDLVYMHQNVPDEYRFPDTRPYSGDSGEIDPNIVESTESSRVHTIGNENLLRDSLRQFNALLMDKFGEREYNSVGNELYGYRVISYGVSYVTYDLVGNKLSEEKYYTPDFERFDDDYSVKLYKDTSCKTLVKTVPISTWSNEKRYVIRWDGDRYYETVTTSSYNRSEEVDFSCPVLTSNDSNGVKVSCTHANDVWRLFNGVYPYMGFGKNISESNPFILYFSTQEPIRLTGYLITSDNQPTYVEYPIDWTIEASYDNRTWYQIDKQMHQTFAQNETRIFTCDATTYFGYYRWKITNFHCNPNPRGSLKGMEIQKFTFWGKVSVSTIDPNSVQPLDIGQTSSKNVSEYDVNTASTIESSGNLYNTFGKLVYDKVQQNDVQTSFNDNTYNAQRKVAENAQEIVLYNVDKNWSLNNVSTTTTGTVRQDNLVRKEDYEQLRRVLNKIDALLNTRDNWFDNNGRCSYNCQVACQSVCQLSCQGCNTRQCHNQKCGTH